MDRLEQSIKFGQKNQNKIAILFIDLDNFKEINDSLGHKIGDEVLLKVAKRIKEKIKNSVLNVRAFFNVITKIPIF